MRLAVDTQNRLMQTTFFVSRLRVLGAATVLGSAIACTGSGTAMAQASASAAPAATASATTGPALPAAQKAELDRQTQAFTGRGCGGQENYKTFNLSPQLSRMVVNLIYGQTLKAAQQKGAVVVQEKRDHAPEQFRLLLRNRQGQQSFVAFLPADSAHYALLGCQVAAPPQ